MGMAQDRPYEDPLAMAKRHLREAESRVARQEALVRELALDGHDTSLSRALLETMAVTLDLMRQHARAMARDRDAPAPAPSRAGETD
jgi:hypothetical protein